MPRSRSFTRLTIRVGLEHLGQSMLLLVSIIFLRSPVLAIFAIVLTSPVADLVILAHAPGLLARPFRERNRSSHDFPRDESKGKNRGENLRLVYTIPACKRDGCSWVQGAAFSYADRKNATATQEVILR